MSFVFALGSSGRLVAKSYDLDVIWGKSLVRCCMAEASLWIPFLYSSSFYFFTFHIFFAGSRVLVNISWNDYDVSVVSSHCHLLPAFLISYILLHNALASFPAVIALQLMHSHSTSGVRDGELARWGSDHFHSYSIERDANMCGHGRTSECWRGYC